MHITEINIYPIKSTAGTALREAEVALDGLALDRRWMLVDRNGAAITAREFPSLTLVVTRYTGEYLLVAAPAMPELRIARQQDAAPLTTVCIWDDECMARVLGEPFNRWFSQYLGVACRLVQLSEAHPRLVDPDFGRPDDTVSFADAFPVLLISQASLDELNRRLPTPVSMRRFRPNVVVQGCAPHAEDRWRRIRLGNLMFEGTKNCSRCVLTTVDPDTGRADPQREPLRTLASYRRQGNHVYFGRNFIPRSVGTIRLGEPVEVLE